MVCVACVNDARGVCECCERRKRLIQRYSVILYGNYWRYESTQCAMQHLTLCCSHYHCCSTCFVHCYTHDLDHEQKSFDQISNAVAHIAATGTFPIILGGDHSIGFPTVRGLASVTTKNIGIIHVDRHADIQEKDMDERMHTTPYFHATNLPNVKPKNLVQIGIGGWQVPRAAVPNMIERETNIFTMDDIEVSSRKLSK